MRDKEPQVSVREDRKLSVIWVTYLYGNRSVSSVRMSSSSSAYHSLCQLIVSLFTLFTSLNNDVSRTRPGHPLSDPGRSVY